MLELLLKKYCEEQGIKDYSLKTNIWRYRDMSDISGPKELVLAQNHAMVTELVLYGILENEAGKLPVLRSFQDMHDYTDSVFVENYNFEYAIQVKSNHISFHRLRLSMEFPASNEALFSSIKTGYIKYISIIPKL